MFFQIAAVHILKNKISQLSQKVKYNYNRKFVFHQKSPIINQNIPNVTFMNTEISIDKLLKYHTLYKSKKQSRVNLHFSVFSVKNSH